MRHFLKEIYPWQKKAWSLLEAMVAQSRIPSALLIAGVQGLGKLALAHYLIRFILCQGTKNKQKPCGSCPPCLSLNKDDLSNAASQAELHIRHSYEPSVIYCTQELNNKGKISDDIRINQIRTFCQALYRTANYFKIGLLWYADRLNAESANGLLKTLEEPPTNTLIILLAHQKSNLTQTILSRCQNVMIAPSYSLETQHWLAEQITDKANLANDDIQNVLTTGHGQPLTTLAMINSGQYAQYKAWQTYLIKLANKPDQISQTQPDSITLGLNCLADLLKTISEYQLVQQQTNNTALNRIIDKSNPIFLLKLLYDTQTAISLTQSTVNLSLLMNNILVVWSHITHLMHYPTIINES